MSRWYIESLILNGCHCSVAARQRRDASQAWRTSQPSPGSHACRRLRHDCCQVSQPSCRPPWLCCASAVPWLCCASAVAVSVAAVVMSGMATWVSHWRRLAGHTGGDWLFDWPCCWHRPRVLQLLPFCSNLFPKCSCKFCYARLEDLDADLAAARANSAAHSAYLQDDRYVSPLNHMSTDMSTHMSTNMSRHVYTHVYTHV